ncbi:hypothetical protein [Flavobacterium sp. NRK1]|uniref:hypothetical protein n=1 Tax=Flavobacterium sp. NRK1 TaxID=2954929 RepID=UPI002092C540|nr:hypothetical protein [Flavobacterium sp. NRK1]MCO6149091.1 hypothetical protein [Flavobacterium sp. NRK1]
MQAQLIDIQEFMAHLKAEGLVIVRGDELENVKQHRLNALRAKLLKRNALTYKEVLSLELLPVSSKQSLQRWIENGKIKPLETYETAKGVRMIMTSALRRLGYTE